MDQKPVAEGRTGRALLRLAIELLVVGSVLVWAFWPTFSEMVHRWEHDPRYSHGYFVPAFALFFLWLRRSELKTITPRLSWWGLAFVAAGVVLRVVGAHYYFLWFDALSLLPMLAGVCLLLGGWPVLRWSWQSIAFLFFMVPLPYRIEVALAGPLQQVATWASTFLLEALGVPALAEGNVIQLDNVQLGIVEACSGLSMLFTFFAITTALALVMRRPLADRILIVLSAVPIALLANVGRITLTGVLHETVGKRVADAVYHDLAGWLMMPLALVLLWAEIWWLSRLLIEFEPSRALQPELIRTSVPALDRRVPLKTTPRRRR